MKLIVVESPTKAKTLTKFLGSGFKVTSSMGHIRDLPKSGLGVDVDHNFKPEYEIIKGKNKIVKELRTLAKQAKEIYLATDPDREGEAIAYHVAWVLSHRGKKELDLKNFKRVTFHEITERAIKAALESPGEIDFNLVNAQQARRILDRLVGYTLSPVLWKKVRRGLSAGRVQSVAVKLVVEREKEREAFKPKEYWEMWVRLKAKAGILKVELDKFKNKKIELSSEEEMKKVKEDLRKAKYWVKEVQEKEIKSPAPAPFTTSVLQQTAANVFGWSAKRTMSLAQDLYERGLITYHRTDSVNLAMEAVMATRDWIKKEFGDEYLPAKPNIYKTRSKVAQEAHEAIRPTRIEVSSEAIGGGKLNQSHAKLYDLIRTRMLQSQMKAAVYMKTVIKVASDNDYELKTEGKLLKFLGWKKLAKKETDVELVKVGLNENLDYINVISEQKFTKPPARYTEAGLIKELEKRGIGRPSTYATIISTIQGRMYVEKEAKRFKPTNIGRAVTQFLDENFKQIMDYDFTARMEDELDEIAGGKKDWVQVLRNFWEPFITKVKEVEKVSKRVAIAVESTGKKCPKCKEGELVIRMGRFGKFLSCSRFPECDYKAPYVEEVKGYVCPECGNKIVVRRTRKGRTFYGCAKYPKCKWAGWKLSEAKKID